MKAIHDPQRMKRRCQIIERMGFVCVEDRDSIVYHESQPTIVYDLSARHEDFFMEAILQRTYDVGCIDGQNETRKQLAELTRPIELSWVNQLLTLLHYCGIVATINRRNV